MSDVEKAIDLAMQLRSQWPTALGEAAADLIVAQQRAIESLRSANDSLAAQVIAATQPAPVQS